MTPTVACVDLDRTLIYSASALDLRMPDHEAPRLLAVEVYQREPLSYITESAGHLLGGLPDDLLLVPTTTRTPEQLARVHLPMPASRYAIAANGGFILVDGTVDRAWSGTVRANLATAAPLADVVHHLGQWADAPFMMKQRTASDLFAYCVVDRGTVPPSLLEELDDWLTARGWRLSLQGRKLYAVPSSLTKTAAAVEVATRCGANGFIAAGDSLLDAELLESAARAARPSAGELADAGWTCPGLTVLRQPGVLGGQELITWLVARAEEERLGPHRR